MHTGLRIAAMLLLLATAGCRSQGELDLAERDLRLQENRIYKLQDYVHQYQMMLEECEAENEQLRKQLADAGRTPETPRSGKPRRLLDMLGGGDSNRSESRSNSRPSGPELNLPVTPNIDLGTEFDPTQTTPSPVPSTNPMRSQKPATEDSSSDNESSNEGSSEAPRFTPSGPAELPEPDELPAPSGAGSGTGANASQLAIRAIGQVDESNSISGESGLLVVVEPRSAGGGSARAPQGATMSIMLVTGESENVLGRWDYSEDDTAAAYRAGFGGASSWKFVLPLMLDTSSPNKLKLYVRMVLPDGTKILTEKEFDTASNSGAGSAVEEIPAGNVGWSRSERPLKAFTNFIGRELRAASQGFTSSGQGSSRSGTASRRSGGNQAPAWQLQEMQPPAVSVGSMSSSAGSAGSSGSGNTAKPWQPDRTAGPVEAQSESNTTSTAPKVETARKTDRPEWSPYR